MKSLPIDRCLFALWCSLSLSACPRPQNTATAPSQATESEKPKDAEAPNAPESRSGQFVSHAELVIPVDASDPTWGAGSAPVTLVQFFDLQCPFSARVAPTVKALMTEYGPDKLRVVFKSTPLAFHKLAPMAHDALLAVYAIAGPDAFENYKSLIYSHQDEMTDENLLSWAQQVGVPSGELQRELASDRPSAKVASDQELAKKLGVRGTPDFFINGISLGGAETYEEFSKIIDAELTETAALHEAGADPMAVYSLRLRENYRSATERQETRRAKARTIDPENTRWKLPVLATDPVRGPKDALVTIIFFSEFQCPFCKRVLPTLEQIQDEYGKDVRLVWKDNPLSFHPNARPAAKVARYILKKRGNDAFWKAHDGLFDHQPNLDATLYNKLLQDAGLTFSGYESSQNDLEAEVAASIQLAHNFGARGTPYFFINGRTLSGAQPFENFKTVIDEQLSIARTLVHQGVARAAIYETLMKIAEEPELVKPLPQKAVQKPLTDTPYLGKKTARIVVQGFSDFQCPFCRRVEPTIRQFLNKHPGEIVFYFRHLPLPFHKDAPLAAEAAHEVFVQKGNEAFFRFRDLVFNNGIQGNRARFARTDLETFALNLGIDMTRFKDALDTRKHRARIEADIDAAKAADISGTPGFVVGSVFVSGARPLEYFEKALAQELQAQGK